ncbi:MAG TPA: ABC transporter permease [Puia sp.]|jgi:putative ABC transport system permease protein
MLKNYIKIAYRSIFHNKSFSFINIFGLAIGLACSLLIFLFVKDEISYDRDHKDADHIYRVVKDFVNDDGSRLPDATTPPALAPAIKKDIPEIIQTTRIFPNWGDNFLISYGERKIFEEKLYRVDSSFFDVFTFPFIAGDQKTVFKDINSIILTETAAARYFGNENPLGKILKVGQFGEMKITGILKDLPTNVHFHFDFLISTAKFGNQTESSWGWYNFYTYIKVRPGTDMRLLTRKIQTIYKKNNADGKNIFHLQPLTSIHLESNLKWELEANSDKLYVYVFATIGLFIIFIAGMNYINLTTAKASVRSKEIGVRKVSGAIRVSLIKQFLVESVIYCILACVLALIIAQLLVPTVNILTQKNLSLSKDPLAILCTLISSILLGVVAGFFPALYLSSFKPMDVLKGFSIKEKNILNLRKSLVVVQFTISIVLIIGALVISQQLKFIQSAKLGINKDQVVIVKNAGYLSRNDRNAFQHVALQIPGVKNISTSDGVVGGQNWTTQLKFKSSGNGQLVNFLSVGGDYLNVLGIEIKEGRGYSQQFPADSMNNGKPGGPLEQTIGSIILNETAVKSLGIPKPAVGKLVLWSTDADTMYYATIVGVTKDFHFTSFHNEIKPFAFTYNPRRVANFTIKLSTNDVQGSLNKLKSAWNQFSADKPFEYHFLDETYASLYASENRFQKVFIILVMLGIIIASLGLFGLSTFAARQRVKEIGIRKVLGASVSGIVGLLSKDFLKLIVIALLLAIPVAWFVLNKWLENFAYRINIKWWVFLVAAFIALSIAIFTVSSQAIKAALANPVKSLRSE